MKKLLIIGGSKFIGKSFIKYFDSYKKFKNLKVIIISRGCKFKKKINNNLIIINKDFLHVKNLPECDYILYCLRSRSLKNDNVLFKNFKEKISRLKYRPKIIFTSSGVVYGLNNKKQKIDERQMINSHNINKLENYKEKWYFQKSNLEKKFFELSQKNFKIIILRMFSFIGPSITSQNYVPKIFLERIINQKEIVINGPINTFRSYLDEKDMVEWIIKIFKKFNKKFDIFNFGSEKAIRIYDLAIKMIGKNKKKNILLLNKSKKLDYYVPRTLKLKKQFDLKEKITLDKAIINLFKQ
tara:strand:+ start:1274 stop:2164 length:891 start_codon:yes stop_codon:yes gene_type:complete